VDRYIETVKKLYDELKECQDKAKETMVQARIKQIQKMVSNLKSATYKNNVMTECCEVFYDPQFLEKLDTDPYLICFKNGVYDLRQNTFRKGCPDDYLSKSMPINYTKFSEDDEKVHDVFTFLEQVFPDKSVRKYFLDVSSDVFVGGNHEKIVLFWTGEGDNGKSVTQNFFDLMLGKLSIKLNTNIITGKKPSAGSAFADLARAGGGVRWAVLEEPDADEMINTGIFKHLSGNDKFYARDLFEKGKDSKEITPLFKLVFICVDENTPVTLPSGISVSIKNLSNISSTK
jgi:phage/plasmid-associated DNA primase